MLKYYVLFQEGSTKFLSATQMPFQEPISQQNQDYWTGERNGASSRIPDEISVSTCSSFVTMEDLMGYSWGI